MKSIFQNISISKRPNSTSKVTENNENKDLKKQMKYSTACIDEIPENNTRRHNNSKRTSIFRISRSLGGPISVNSIQRSPKHEFGSLSSYLRMEKLGEGTYANVYKAVSKITSEVVAIKILKIQENEGAPCTALREISLLRQLKHANIICLHDVINSVGCLAFVVEYMDLDLRDLIRSPFDLPSHDILIFLYQILRGIQFCHSQKILHRDLKPHNLLVACSGDLKIADFGLARSQGVPSKNYTSEVVTLWYRPPDVIMGFVNYNYGIDIWSIGCIALEMYMRRAPFMSKSNYGQLQVITNVLGEINKNNMPYLHKLPDKSMMSVLVSPRNPGLKRYEGRINELELNLISEMLAYDQGKRPTAITCMENKIFSEIREKIGIVTISESIFKNGVLKLQSSKSLKRCAKLKLSKS